MSYYPVPYGSDYGFEIFSQKVQMKLGSAVGREIYSHLEPRYLEPPKNLPAAYTRALYFVGIAARRADAENNTAAEQELRAAYARIAEEKDESTADLYTLSGVSCRLTGYFCKKGGELGVLREARLTIEDSSLNSDDKARLSAYLKAVAAPIRKKQILKASVLVGVSGLLAYALWQKKAKSQ